MVRPISHQPISGTNQAHQGAQPNISTPEMTAQSSLFTRMREGMQRFDGWVERNLVGHFDRLGRWIQKEIQGGRDSKNEALLPFFSHNSRLLVYLPTGTERLVIGKDTGHFTGLLTLPEKYSRNLSSEHCAIEKNNDGWSLRNLSIHGTWILHNGEPVHVKGMWGETAIHSVTPGDLISLYGFARFHVALRPEARPRSSEERLLEGPYRENREHNIVRGLDGKDYRLTRVEHQGPGVYHSFDILRIKDRHIELEGSDIFSVHQNRHTVFNFVMDIEEAHRMGIISASGHSTNDTFFMIEDFGG